MSQSLAAMRRRRPFDVNTLIIEAMLRPRLLAVFDTYEKRRRKNIRYKALPRTLVSKNIYKNRDPIVIVIDAAQFPVLLPPKTPHFAVNNRHDLYL